MLRRILIKTGQQAFAYADARFGIKSIVMIVIFVAHPFIPLVELRVPGVFRQRDRARGAGITGRLTMSQPGFVNTKCLFCEEAQDRVLYKARLYEKSLSPEAFSARRQRKREHYRTVACKGCGLVRSDPILGEEEISSLYAESLFQYAREAPFAARTYAELFSRLARDHLPRLPGSLLEIGSSTGFFLEQAKALGVREVMGFEPSRECVENAPKTIRECLIPDIYRPELLNGKVFDMAASFHVLDHLIDPLSHLVSLGQHVRPGGHVLFVCHDVESLGAKILGSHNPIFDVEHIYLFSKHTLTRLLSRAGFVVLEAGSLANRYPLVYWFKLLPFGEALGNFLPKRLREKPVTLRAGNLYVLGKKSGESC